MVQAPKKEYFLKDAPLNRVCVLEDLDFFWDNPELKVMKKMWLKGFSVLDIANHFDRDPDEVILALMHLARKDKITARKTGLKGEAPR